VLPTQLELIDAHLHRTIHPSTHPNHLPVKDVFCVAIMSSLRALLSAQRFETGLEAVRDRIELVGARRGFVLLDHPGCETQTLGLLVHCMIECANLLAHCIVGRVNVCHVVHVVDCHHMIYVHLGMCECCMHAYTLIMGTHACLRMCMYA